MVCCVRLHLILSAKALGMLVKSAHKNWEKGKEDKFCADTFDVLVGRIPSFRGEYSQLFIYK